MKPKAFVQTYGCQMNEHDSARMIDILTSMDYEMTSEVSQADLVLVNTCSVRHNPENKVYSFLGTLPPVKRQRANFIVGVAGCVAQQEGRQILRRSKVVDMVFGPDNYFRLPEMIEAVQGGERIVMTEFLDGRENVRNFIPDKWLEQGHIDGCRSYIAISKGCNNFCSFCIVPRVRGREVHREPENVIQEAQALIDRGAKEIWLLGQNVNSYRAGDVGFLELLDRVSQLPVPRIRFTSPHPKDWDNALSDLMAARPSICNQLHLPLQAGSDRILKHMNRRHTLTDYLDKVAYLKSVVPGVEISTDFIVGYPTETHAEYEETLRAMEEVEFSQIFSFKYSPRPGTKAAKLDDDVPREEKEARLARLIALQESINLKKMNAYVGQEVEVLIDGRHRKNPGVWSGRTGGFRPVSITSPGLAIGGFVHARITGAHGHWLEGELLS
ncbi:MAG: tRNA (N6-isopentenyl adenosine(37)-C2)-methylthiotransferase MiaB [Nitrospiraceae bacterium]|nr:tRNA (N6-isopentenyl adenosine(37)-C2)-methylthiotransferase MiaB [Nitrospiraceae bacterium]